MLLLSTWTLGEIVENDRAGMYVGRKHPVVLRFAGPSSFRRRRVIFRTRQRARLREDSRILIHTTWMAGYIYIISYGARNERKRTAIIARSAEVWVQDTKILL